MRVRGLTRNMIVRSMDGIEGGGRENSFVFVF